MIVLLLQSQDVFLKAFHDRYRGSPEAKKQVRYTTNTVASHTTIA